MRNREQALHSKVNNQESIRKLIDPLCLSEFNQTTGAVNDATLC